jgi:transcriptional antiterminator NusG
MPGYLLVNVEFNERILYLFRETSGVGDFVGGGPNKPPQPMQAHEIDRWLGTTIHPERELEAPKSKFSAGDRVRVKDGTFAGMEGVVKEILEQKGALTVELTIFGRPVPVELEYWQVDFV